MKTKKLFLLGRYDREDGGFLGESLSLEVPDSIRTYPDAVEHLQPILCSTEFIQLMYELDYKNWFDELNYDREFTLNDFKLDSVSYVGGQCRWVFSNEDEDQEVIVDKSMDFVTLFVP